MRDTGVVLCEAQSFEHWAIILLLTILVVVTVLLWDDMADKAK